MNLSPLAGKPAPPGILVDVSRLVTAYYTGIPDVAVPARRVAFGMSGHRGSSLDLTGMASSRLATAGSRRIIIAPWRSPCFSSIVPTGARQRPSERPS